MIRQNHQLHDQSFLLKQGWYLIYCKYNEETRTCHHLGNQNITHYCPLITVNNQSQRLFPQYAFVYLSENTVDQYQRIRHSRGVKDFVRPYHCSLESSLPVPIHNGDEVIRQIQVIENCQDFTAQSGVLTPLQAGDEVLLSSPLYQCLKATFLKSCGKDRALVLLEYLQKHRHQGRLQQKALGKKEVTVPLNILGTCKPSES